MERTISAGAGCSDVPVRGGGASLLLPSTGCVWRVSLWYRCGFCAMRVNVAETELAGRKLQ